MPANKEEFLKAVNENTFCNSLGTQWTRVTLNQIKLIFKNYLMKKHQMKEDEILSLNLCRVAVFCTTLFPVLRKNVDNRMAA